MAKTRFFLASCSRRSPLVGGAVVGLSCVAVLAWGGCSDKASPELSDAGEWGPGGEQVDGSGQVGGDSPPVAEDEPPPSGHQNPGDATLSASQKAVLDACEEATGTRSFEDCPIEVLCSGLQPEDSVPIEVEFEPNFETCEWGDNEAFVSDTDQSNLTILNKFTRARFEQSKDLGAHLEVDEGQRAVFCKIDIEVSSLDPERPNRFLYDDDLLLVFGGYDESSGVEGGVLLMTGNASVPGPMLAGVSELPGVEWPLYEWRDLAEVRLSNGGGGAQLHCLGYDDVDAGDAQCALPATDTTGPFHLSLPDNVATGLGVRAAINGNYNLSVVTTGDNDRGDCEHRGFRAKVDVGYVVLPQEAVQDIEVPLI